MAHRQREADPDRGWRDRARRVLVVDDDRAVRRIVRAMLEIDGLVVEEESVAEAVAARVARAGPDLVLLDQHMPVRSGLEVLGEIRAAGSRVPVVILSGGDDPELAIAARAAGAAAYLVKPVTLAQLRAAVRLALGPTTAG